MTAVVEGVRVRRAGLCVLLGIVFVVSLLWLVAGHPSSLLTLILLATASISLGCLAAFYLPASLPRIAKRFIGAAVGCAALLVGYLAIPGVGSDPEPVPSATSTQPASPVTTPAAAPPPDPLTATLKLGPRGACEGFVVKNSLLHSVPDGEGLNAEWAYRNGGATMKGQSVLTVQGNSEDTVILEGIHVVDFSSRRAQAGMSEISPCDPQGGDQAVRYFDVVLKKRPQVIARPAVDPDAKGKIQPAAKFPLKVSNSDAESFQLDVQGPPCICSWRLAIDWTSGGRSGRKIVDHDFGEVVTNTTKGLPFYWRDADGSWIPDLPN